MMVGLFFFGVGITIQFTKSKLVVLGALWMLGARINWVYGHPQLYDLDILIPKDKSFLLMMKYYAATGCILLYLTRGKIRAPDEKFVSRRIPAEKLLAISNKPS